MPHLTTRRRFLQESLGTGAALALLGSGGAFAARQPRRLQHVLSCETYSLRDLLGNGQLTLQGVPRLLKEQNIKGITWNDMFFSTYDKSLLDELKAATKEQGRVTTGFILEGSLASDDEAARKRQIEENLRELEVAAYLGAPVVRVNLGGAGSPEQDATVGVQRVIAAFKQMLPTARRLGVRLSMENHGGVSGTADNIARISDGTDRKWVGSCLDFGNWPDDVRLESCRMLAPYAYHTHAKAHSFNAEGEDPNINFGAIIGYLKKAKYRGAVSIEWEGEGDPLDGIRKSRDLVRKYYPELG